MQIHVMGILRKDGRDCVKLRSLSTNEFPYSVRYTVSSVRNTILSVRCTIL